MTTVAQGATVGLLAEFFEYPGGPLQDLTGVTVTITPVAGGAAVVGPTGVDHPAVGTYTYSWAVGVGQAIGDYLVVWQGLDGDSEIAQATEVVTVAGSEVAAPGTPRRRPNSQLVVNAWVNSLSELHSRIAGSTLPEDNTTWGATGYVVATIVGGNKTPELPRHFAVAQLDVYAITPNSEKPLWARINNIIQSIVAATEVNSWQPKDLTLTTGGKSYGTARILEAWPLTEERPVYGDPGGYAHMIMDIGFVWVPLGSGS